MCNVDENVIVVKNTYNEIAEFFPPMLCVDNSSVEEVQFMDEFLSLIGNKGSVADLGCGVGKHGRYCASKGCSVTGYDISEKMIELAKQNNDEFPMKFLQVADMRYITSDTIFDAVVAMYSFIHLTVDQAHQTLKNIVNYLKDGAYLVLTVYNGQRNNFVDEALAPTRKIFYKDYTEDEIRDLVESEGFEVKQILLWNDLDEITGSNDDVDFGVIGIICRWNGRKRNNE